MIYGFWLETPTHWILCEVLSHAMGRAVVRLYNETQTRTGKYRQNGAGILVEPK
jgi:hypothetical protein